VAVDQSPAAGVAAVVIPRDLRQHPMLLPHRLFTHPLFTLRPVVAHRAVVAEEVGVAAVVEVVGQGAVSQSMLLRRARRFTLRPVADQLMLRQEPDTLR
jgi:hypothetical protein